MVSNSVNREVVNATERYCPKCDPFAHRTYRCAPGTTCATCQMVLTAVTPWTRTTGAASWHDEYRGREKQVHPTAEVTGNAPTLSEVVGPGVRFGLHAPSNGNSVIDEATGSIFGRFNDDDDVPF